MGVKSLHYLNLCGVKWELSETQVTTDPIKTQDTTNTNTKTDAQVSVIPVSAPISIDYATSAAQNAGDLATLATAIEQFNHPLKQFVKNTAMPHLADNTELLIITDAPSADDDDNGAILTGAAGELMDKMLGAIGMTRANVSIVPLIFWRTPGGRSPAREELDLGRPFVNRAIDLLRPRVILTLGILTAAEIVNAKLPKDHGTLFETANGTPVLPIYHPNYLMLKVDAKKDAWEALQKLQKLLKTA